MCTGSTNEYWHEDELHKSVASYPVTTMADADTSLTMRKGGDMHGTVPSLCTCDEMFLTLPMLRGWSVPYHQLRELGAKLREVGHFVEEREDRLQVGEVFIELFLPLGCIEGGLEDPGNRPWRYAVSRHPTLKDRGLRVLSTHEEVVAWLSGDPSIAKVVEA